MITRKCKICNKDFIVENRELNRKVKPSNKNHKCYCSKKCSNEARIVRVDVNCGNCGKQFQSILSRINDSKSGKVFCSKSCSCTYGNTHKSTGNRRSKLESWIEKQLTDNFPSLIINYNCKDVINSELDIYIPSLKLAVELNGIFHYEPIYGPEKLTSIQNNDNRKFQACLDVGIELVIIDTSGQKYFKQKTAQEYLDIIMNIITNKLQQ